MPISTLSYGFKKPSNPTTGDLFFPAMETNIQLLNDHTHNTVNSAPIAAELQTVSSGSWGSDLGGGNWKQTITLPHSRQYDNTRIEVRRSTGEVVYPTIEKASATTFLIYTNDNSLAYTINYV